MPDIRAHPYAAHRAFVAPALASRAFSRVVIGVIAIELMYQFTVDFLPDLIALVSPDFADAFLAGDTRLGLLAQLFSFGFLGLWVLVIARMRHGRDLRSLIGPPDMAARQLAKVFVATILVFIASELLPPYWNISAIAEIVSPLVWVTMLPLSLAALFVQTGAEELMYRGYVQQQIAARWDSPWIWLTLPNLLFASAHWNVDSDLIGNLQYVLWAFVFGLAASDLTARSGTLGPAIGFHMANNAFAFLFFGELDGLDSGLALLLFEPGAIGPTFEDTATAIWMLPPLSIELGMVGLLWLAARLALRR